MPDRAYTSRDIPSLYNDVYDQIEDNQSPESIAQNLEVVINKDIKKNGADAKNLIKSISPDLQYLSGTLFAADEEFKQDVRRKIEKAETSADEKGIHIAHAVEASLLVCGMLGKSAIDDVLSEVNIQYHLNIADGILEQIELQIWIDTKADMDNRLIRVRNIYEDRLRESSNHKILRGNDALSDIDISIGTIEI